MSLWLSHFTDILHFIQNIEKFFINHFISYFIFFPNSYFFNNFFKIPNNFLKSDFICFWTLHFFNHLYSLQNINISFQTSWMFSQDLLYFLHSLEHIPLRNFLMFFKNLFVCFKIWRFLLRSSVIFFKICFILMNNFNKNTLHRTFDWKLSSC